MGFRIPKQTGKLSVSKGAGAEKRMRAALETLARSSWDSEDVRIFALEALSEDCFVVSSEKQEYPFKTILPPKRHGHPWHKSEGDWVTRAYHTGSTLEEIATVCDRTVRAIECFLSGQTNRW